MSPLLFVIVMEAISREFRVALPCEQLYADDLVVIGKTEHDLIKRLNEWKDKWSKQFDIRPHRCRTWTVQSYCSGGTNVHPIYRKPKMVAMATSRRTSKSAMSSSDSLTPNTHP